MAVTDLGQTRRNLAPGRPPSRLGQLRRHGDGGRDRHRRVQHTDRIALRRRQARARLGQGDRIHRLRMARQPQTGRPGRAPGVHPVRGRHPHAGTLVSARRRHSGRRSARHPDRDQAGNSRHISGVPQGGSDSAACDSRHGPGGHGRSRTRGASAARTEPFDRDRGRRSAGRRKRRRRQAPGAGREYGERRAVQCIQAHRHPAPGPGTRPGARRRQRRHAGGATDAVRGRRLHGRRKRGQGGRRTAYRRVSGTLDLCQRQRQRPLVPGRQLCGHA